jgi:CIC family chloride channel protein
MKRGDDQPSARFLLAIVAVGVGAALFAVSFRLLLSFWYHTMFHANTVVDAVSGSPRWLRVAMPCAGGAGAGLISLIRASRRQNVSNVMEAIALGHVRLSLRATLSRVASSWAAIAGGLSIGREGPLIEFGGSLGAAMGRAFATPVVQTRLLIAAGTAAGFAAAYNTPLAAVLFVFETIAGVAALELLLPVMIATVLATVVTRVLAGGGPLYGQRAFSGGQPAELFTFALLGLVAAGVAMGFKAALAAGEQLFEASALPRPLRTTIGGAIVGAIAAGLPAVVGNGYEPLNGLLNGQVAVVTMSLLVLAKVVATSASVGSGIPGGVFTPMLLVGGAVGVMWIHVAAGLGLQASAGPGTYALVGMAAAAAASTHAPLTAAVMIFEVSGDYAIVVPLVLTTAVAVAISRALGSESVYEAELRRRELGWEMTLEGRHIETHGP